MALKEEKCLMPLYDAERRVGAGPVAERKVLYHDMDGNLVDDEEQGGA